jgi:hypothetical protein
MKLLPVVVYVWPSGQPAEPSHPVLRWQLDAPEERQAF